MKNTKRVKTQKRPKKLYGFTFSYKTGYNNNTGVITIIAKSEKEALKLGPSKIEKYFFDEPKLIRITLMEKDL